MSANSMFRHKFALCYTGYAKSRFPNLMSECERTGLENMTTVWQTDNPFDEVIRANVPMSRWMQRHPNHLSCALGHYRIAKTAYALGYDRIFVIEDDVAFSSIEELDAACDALPARYDIALFDYFRPNAMSPEEFSKRLRDGKVNDRWSRMRDARGMSCYAMTRRGMKWFTSITEASVLPGGLFRVNDQYLTESRLGGTVLVCATPVVAIQHNDSSVSGPKYGLYEEMGVDVSRFIRSGGK